MLRGLFAYSIFASLAFATGAHAQSTPEEIVDSFHVALKAGDSALALSLLAGDVSIFEMGAVDAPRDVYAAGHLKHDIVFAQKTGRELLSRQSGQSGDGHWVLSRYRIRYPNGARPDEGSTETVILERSGDAWRITHIHWSSGPLHHR